MTSAGNYQRFRDWLLIEMGKRDWSQSDFARAAELNRAVINKLLNGQSTPRPETLEAIAHAFKIPTERIFRVAGILPEIPEQESFMEEVNFHLRRLRNPRRKATALVLIKALIAEEEEEEKW